MKNILYILLCLFVLINNQVSYAQDPVFAQFYASPLHVNPAMTGVFEGKFRVVLNYRDQWSSVLKDNPFRTIGASVDVRQAISKSDFFALGLSVLHDEAGVGKFSQNRIHLAASYMKQMGGGRYRRSDQFLIAGGQVGFGQNQINWNNLWFNNQFDPTTWTPSPGTLPTGENGITGDNQSTDLFLDANVGLVYYALFGENRSIYVGGAMHHLNSPNISFLEDRTDLLYTRWVGQVGGQLPLTRQLSLLPSGLITGQGPSLQTITGASIRYSNNDREELALRLGTWARISQRGEQGTSLESIIAGVVLEKGDWNFGVSYDITTSSFTAANNARGAFEVSMIYIHPANRRIAVNCPKF